MKPLETAKKTAKWVKDDRLKYRRWSRSFMAWLGAMGAMLAPYGMETMAAWSLREWGKRLLIAGLFGAVGAMNLGDKNPEPPQSP